MKHTSVYVIPIAIVVIAAGIFWYERNKNQPSYQTVAVARGSVTQEVLASGNVQSPTTTNLHFQSAGKLVSLSAAVNQEVAAGDVLARQDTSVQQAQLAQAQAAVAAATAALAQLENGATPQSIAVPQSAVASAMQSLQNSYSAIPNTLADAYAKANDAVTSELAPLFANAQGANPQLTFTVNSSQIASDISFERAQAGTELGAWQEELSGISTSSASTSLDQALLDSDAQLAPLQVLLTTAVSALAANGSLSASAATTYRASASAGLNEITAAISQVRALEQAIASQKAAVAQAQSALDLTSASSTATNILQAQAQVAQAQANADVIRAQIANLEIIAPAPGIVTDTKGSVGEVVTPDIAVVSLIPKGILQTKVHVSEDTIVGVRIGQAARIELDAFPSGTEFAGTVTEIDPAETVIGGAIYYQTTLQFDHAYDGIKPGMTANVWIDTGYATSTLEIPASALGHDGAKASVQVYRDGAVSVHDVTTGLKDQKGMVEVTSGLQEGDLVVVGSN